MVGYHPGRHIDIIMIRIITSYWTKWVTLGAIGVLLLLCGFFYAAISVARMDHLKPTENALAEFTVIPAPTATQTLSPQQALATPTTRPYVSPEGISVGVFVQISGTDGHGLRLREGPGTTYAMRFVGMDAEVFQVKDGPKESDGFMWWYLVASYDDARSGWAASDYMTVVAQSQD